MDRALICAQIWLLAPSLDVPPRSMYCLLTVASRLILTVHLLPALDRLG